MAASATTAMAEFVAGLKYEDLPSGVVEMAKRVLLDAAGCALAAFREDPRKAAIAVGLAGQFQAAPQATVIGGAATHPALAALANGILVNAADNDDTHKRALIHVGSVVVPAALAVAEARGGDGRRLIEALVAGYEIAVRVGMAVMPTHYRYWHSTATNGTFGAAAAAAKAAALDAAGVRTALGFAGTQAAGLNTFFETGDDSKSVHPGKAGMNGVLAAVLAELGASSPPEVLEHPKGYLAAFSAEPKPEALTAGLGADWEILRNGFKLYPSILASHSPIGATLEIVARQPIDPTKIAAIAVNTYATVKSHFSSKTVETSMAARLSVPYCVAAAAVDRRITQDQFKEERYRDPLIRWVLDRTEIVVDPELSALYPEKFPARVVITLESGERREATFLYPKGDPSNPLTPAELKSKFAENASAILDDRATGDVLAMIERLEEVDVKELTRLLGARDKRDV